MESPKDYGHREAVEHGKIQRTIDGDNFSVRMPWELIAGLLEFMSVVNTSWLEEQTIVIQRSANYEENHFIECTSYDENGQKHGRTAVKDFAFDCLISALKEVITFIEQRNTEDALQIVIRHKPQGEDKLNVILTKETRHDRPRSAG